MKARKNREPTLAYYVGIWIGSYIYGELDSCWLYYRDRRGDRRPVRYWGA